MLSRKGARSRLTVSLQQLFVDVLSRWWCRSSPARSIDDDVGRHALLVPQSNHGFRFYACVLENKGMLELVIRTRKVASPFSVVFDREVHTLATNKSNLSSPRTGKKYVPPHLRKSQGSGGGSPDQTSSNDRRGSNYSRGGFDDNRRGSSYGRGGGGGGAYEDRRGSGYSSRAAEGPPPVANSRWSSVNFDNGGGGGARRGSNFSTGSAGGGGRRGSAYARVNERGFHGDMKPDKRVEQRLFDNTDKQTTGINFDNYDKIPIEVSGDDIPEPIEVYTVETIGEDLFRNVQLCGYERPTPVQKYSVPIGSAGRDLMACAQTGSGKTAGFLFPIIMAMIKNGGQEPPENSRRRTYPEALVLAPTRELAQQIHDEAKRFCYCTGIASVVIYGGADVRDQLRQIESGCDLLVATPGRLVDLIERGRLGMDNVRFLVLDEADRMLDMGFEVRL